jgi:hypothetical protein
MWRWERALRAALISHVRISVLALAPTDLTVDSRKASALFNLLAPPLHMAGLGVVLP